MCLFVCSVCQDGAELYNTSSVTSSMTSSPSAAAVGPAAVEASCVVGDRLSCGVVFSDDDKKLQVYFLKNNIKVCV